MLQMPRKCWIYAFFALLGQVKNARRVSKDNNCVVFEKWFKYTYAFLISG